MTRRPHLAVVLAATLALGACTSAAGETSDTSGASSASGGSSASGAAGASSAATTILPAAPAFTNDLAEGSAHHEVKVPGEAFSLTIDYWLTTDPAAWTSLNAKTVHYSAHTIAVDGATGDQPTVLVEFNESTAALASTDVALDGQLIASDRDSPATGALPGYIVSGDLPYEGVFDVPANSQTVISRWSELGRATPLDSAMLTASGVYANTVSFTYSLLIRGAGDADGYWHRRVVLDSLTVGTPQG